MIEDAVLERAYLPTPDRVQDACSFARAERILGREYHGRFLIELLQNAADAWRDCAEPHRRTDVRIVLSDAPALVVANRGVTFPAKAVIESLGQIGASTKTSGEAIGHKGIGFKSVLEITRRPELYSGRAGSTDELAVQFHPERALELIRKTSPNWQADVRGVANIGAPLDAVPTLRYPIWVSERPADVQVLVDEGFDTIVRLPFDDHLRPEPGLDRERWLEAIRTGFAQITDEMLLLLGTFERVEIHDELAGTRKELCPSWQTAQPPDERTSKAVVEVHANDDDHSEWLIYSRTFAGHGSLGSEVAVGFRLEGDRLAPAVAGHPSSPFHLFFPTKIGSGLPFLLHGYFEVDAARTRFYEGSTDHNEAVLRALADLVVDAVRDVARTRPVALTTLPDLLGAAGDPENDRAQQFQLEILDRLDEVPWVPVRGSSDETRTASPPTLLVADDQRLGERIVATFPIDYIEQRVSLHLPSAAIGPAGHAFLRARNPDFDVWAALKQLLRPGIGGPWPADATVAGFRSLIELVEALRGSDSGQAKSLLEDLKGDPETCLIPVVAGDGDRRVLPMPNIEEATVGRRSHMVMARVRTGNAEVVPPEWLDFAFLPAGALRSEDEVARARPLGVRPFTVDTVLDRLAGSSTAAVDAAQFLTFVWQLLAREPTGQFSKRQAVDRAADVTAGEFFWCRPGESTRGEGDAQRRRAALATVHLPAADGSWQPASTLAFGEAWAAWLEQGAWHPVTDSMRARARAYRALQAVAPSPASLLASPPEVLPLLPTQSGDDEAYGPDGARERHAFLLLLGVWEVLPIEAHAGARADVEQRRLFDGPWESLREQRVEARGGWQLSDGRSSWGGTRHANVRISEDARFLWPVSEAASRDALAAAHLLERGAPLYGGFRYATAFCPGCSVAGSTHTVRHRSTKQDRIPSLLTLELQESAWVPVVRDGERRHEPHPPARAWWASKLPSRAGLRQSPLRYLPLCEPAAELGEALRTQAGIVELVTAPLQRIRGLLRDLHDEAQAHELPEPPEGNSSAREAFIALHRRAYERLADLVTSPDEARAELEAVGVLADLDGELVWRPPDEVRHDDGRFITYQRYFLRDVPFVVLQRDKDSLAERLGIRPFDVELTRVPSESEVDVTAEATELFGDRIPELLAIVVHHSLGSQTLEPTSEQFAARAHRLRQLRVIRVDDMVIDAQVVDTELRTAIGRGTSDELFLETSAPSKPVLYHDIAGSGWKEGLRRKLHVPLATLLENPAYASTFKLLLVAEDDDEREDLLRELGVTSEHLSALHANLGLISQDDLARQRRWFAAILTTLGDPMREEEEVAGVALHDRLLAAGLAERTVAQLVAAGGGDNVRRAASSSVLPVLVAAGVPLAELHDTLRKFDPTDGLSVDVAAHRLRAWLRGNSRRLSVILAQHLELDDAKQRPHGLTALPEHRFELDPPPAIWLRPVTALLEKFGLQAEPDLLAGRPSDELARLAGCASAAELDDRAGAILDPEERARAFRAAAAGWRKQLVILAVTVRVRRGDPRAVIRSAAADVDRLLPVGPNAPAELANGIRAALVERPALAEAIVDRLEAVVPSLPDRTTLKALAEEVGCAVGHLDEVARVLEAPQSERARRVERDIERLRRSAIEPAVPAGLLAPTPEQLGARRRSGTEVKKVKVDASADARKRRVGEEGEHWMIAAVTSALVELSSAGRAAAIDELAGLLSRFEGAVVEEALRHAELARDPQLDTAELIEELSSFLHLSRLSDGFGFDVLGWVSIAGAAPSAVCLEVKSASSERFQLSRGEWQRATFFHEDGNGDRYAIAVVRRGAAGEPPRRIDLLVDPVHLAESGQIDKVGDGYEVRYRVAT